MFGWVIAGEMCSSTNIEQISINTTSLQHEIDIDRTPTRFWEIENIPDHPIHTAEELLAEELFCKSISRSSDGKYEVELPVKDGASIGNSYHLALTRLLSMERRFIKQPFLKEQYTKFMQEYIDLNHMKRVPDAEICNKNVFYLPHHAVFKPQSSTTKLRVVFDGSCKPDNGLSLNEALIVGPSVQRDLFSICLRFRRFKYVFSADIEKMYRQIWIAKKHQDLQRILWRQHSSDPIEHYRLCTVTYGTASAPFLACRTLKQVALDFRNDFPKASQVLLEDFYVDDVMSGCDTVADILETKVQLTDLLQRAGFNLRKWSTNCWPLINSLPESICEFTPLDFEDENKCVKTLGLQWHPSSDVFSFNVTLESVVSVSKRQLLSEASKIFDPIGFLTPVTVLVKIFFQRLWLTSLTWDEPLPDNLVIEWNNLRKQLISLNSVRIPRQIVNGTSVQFHGFADASESALAAVIYCRSVNEQGHIDVKLVAARSKVSPLKQITLARLELCASVLLTRLMHKVLHSLEMLNVTVFAWTDSQIVLHWLSSIPRRWKTFIANRTSEILETIPRNRWRHVPSNTNPADCASRGMHPNELLKFDLWWQGPSWLRDCEYKWPPSIELLPPNSSELEERTCTTYTVVIAASTSFMDYLINKVSSWPRLFRIVAFCFRFVLNSRCNQAKRVHGCLTVSELSRAKIFCIRYVQGTAFSNEIATIQRGALLPTNSKLIRLSPFLDNDQILRVRGRIQHSELGFSAKHPVILPKHHTVTSMIVQHFHVKHLHVGATHLATILRQEYWILGCRSIIRQVIFKCISCFRQRSATASQIMADLPKHRITYSRPFTNVGCDYAGPLTLRLFRGRNPKFTKAYIALFVCCTTKAIHLELVGDLTTNSFLAALRRFIGRRGKCLHIYSDNGTNFRGADRAISELYELLQSSDHNKAIQDQLSLEGISWSFIPPAAPHFGGLWEAGVRVVKQHLRRVVGASILTYEEMYTVLVQIEAILNSRPLCSVADDEINVLTPAHFLIGHEYTTLPDINNLNTPTSRLTNWELLQNMTRGFWKRWHMDYLTSLQQRPKWYHPQPSIKKDDVVVLKEPNAPPTSWKLAKVVEVHPGDDGRVRVVTVKNSSGLHKRPIVKIVPLPTS